MRDVTKDIPFEQRDTASSPSSNTIQVQEAAKQEDSAGEWRPNPYDWHPRPYFKQRIHYREYEYIEYEREVRNKMDNIKIENNFTEEGLEEVVEFFRQLSGFSIVIDRAVLSDEAIMGKKVTFKARDMVLSECFKLLLSQYGLEYSIRERVIYISRPTDIMK